MNTRIESLTNRVPVLQRPVHPVVVIIVLFFTLLFFASLWHPDYHGSRRGKESTLRGNLHLLRGAIEQFYADTGHYPLVLEDLGKLDARHLITKVKQGTYKGPYLDTDFGIQRTGIPENPFVLVENLNVAAHWHYDAKSGAVKSTVNGVTDEGVPYDRL
ncbi:MAG TPA: hypothetical protein VHV83_10860 [Armatimonadota bacterium]|nr:hypothetical protein [Armatimonadota bacterium]